MIAGAREWSEWKRNATFYLTSCEKQTRSTSTVTRRSWKQISVYSEKRSRLIFYLRHVGLTMLQSPSLLLFPPARLAALKLWLTEPNLLTVNNSRIRPQHDQVGRRSRDCRDKIKRVERGGSGAFRVAKGRADQGWGQSVTSHAVRFVG